MWDSTPHKCKTIKWTTLHDQRNSVIFITKTVSYPWAQRQVDFQRNSPSIKWRVSEILSADTMFVQVTNTRSHWQWRTWNSSFFKVSRLLPIFHLNMKLLFTDEVNESWKEKNNICDHPAETEICWSTSTFQCWTSIAKRDQKKVIQEDQSMERLKGDLALISVTFYSWAGNNTAKKQRLSSG